VREHIIRMATDGGCFIGASLSCTDLLVYLYSDVLRVAPAKINDPNRIICFSQKATTFQHSTVHSSNSDLFPGTGWINI